MPTKSPRTRRRLIKLGILSAPFLAWAAIILIVPTGWARARLSTNLSLATGCPVQIGSLWLGMLGQLRMRDIVISEPGDAGQPWVIVPEAQVDVHLGQILLGRCAPGEIRLLNPSIRLQRGKDGAWSSGRRSRAQGTNGPENGRTKSHSGTTTLVIEGGTLTLIDQASAMQLVLSEIAGRGIVGEEIATIEDFRGTINDGTLNLAAHVEHHGDATRFEVDLRVHSVDIDQSLDGLAYLVPIAAGSEGGIRGTMELHIAASGVGRSVGDAIQAMRGHGSMMISPVDLEGSRLLSELDLFEDWASVDRVGALSCDFKIENRRANTENMTLRIDRFPLVMAGWTDFDGRYDYGVRTDQMSSLVPGDAKGWLKEMGVNFDELKGLRLQGTPDRAVATLNGRPLLDEMKHATSRGPHPAHDVEHSRLRESARRIRDRLFR